MASNFETSLISTQHADREIFLNELIEKMSGSDVLPSVEEIERVWFELQREMTESGRVVSFGATVAKPNGDKVEQSVVRVGTFNLVSEEGKYLTYEPSTGSIQELATPSGSATGWAEDLAEATRGMHTFSIDPTGPTGGTFLSALIDSPTLSERWHQEATLVMQLLQLESLPCFSDFSSGSVIFGWWSKQPAQNRSLQYQQSTGSRP